MKALLWKEFRESVRWLPIAMFVSICWIYGSMPRIGEQYFVTNLEYNFATSFGLLAMLFSLALAILQSAPDLRPSALAYLHHRNVSFAQVALSKLLVGCLMFSIAFYIPLLWFYWYLDNLDIDQIAARGVQVIPAFVVVTAGFMFHPATMLMLARPASWWGTRLLPLIPALGLYNGATMQLQSGLRSVSSLTTFQSRWTLIAIVAIAIYSYLAIQAWQRMSTNTFGGLEMRPGPLFTIFFVGAACFLCFVLVEIANMFNSQSAIRFEKQNRATSNHSVEVDTKTGKIWLVRHDNREQLSSKRTLARSGVIWQPDTKPDFSKAERVVESLVRPVEVHIPRDSLFPDYNQNTYFRQLPDYPNWIADHRGYILQYTQPGSGHIRLKGILNREGDHPPGTLPRNPFANDISRLEPKDGSFLNLNFLVDSEGIYSLELSSDGKITVAEKLKIPINLVGIFSDYYESKRARIYLVTGNELHVYRIVDKNDSEDWLSEFARALEEKSDAVEIPPLHLVLAEKVTNPNSIQFHQSRTAVAETEAGIILLQSTNLGDSIVTRWEGEQSPIITKYRDRSLEPREPYYSLFELGLFPPITTWIGSFLPVPDFQLGRASFSTATGSSVAPSLKPMAFVIPAIAVLTSMAIVLWYLLPYRNLPVAERAMWVLLCLPVGIATPLALVAVHRRLIRETCANCHRARRIDRPRCERCNAEWQTTTPSEIEIFEPTTSEGVAVS